MPRVKETRYCVLCSKAFQRHNGNTDAKYCSIKCACRARNTRDHQVKAGIEGGKHNIAKRGSGTKSYIKYHGRHIHRAIAEERLGRKLEPGEIVHHKDGNKHNNNIRNRQIMTRAEHMKVHIHDKT